MSSQYEYDVPTYTNRYKSLQETGKYVITPGCLVPNPPNSLTRSKRDLEDFNRYVLNRSKGGKNTDEMESYRKNRKNNKIESFCTCSSSDCQHFDRDLDKLEDLYNSGKLTEYNFAGVM